MIRYFWSREFSIRKSSDFVYLKENGKKFYFKNFIVWFKKEERTFPPVRLAVVVRKSVGKAVIRNRIRRLVKEFFRLNQHDLPKGDYVVIVKRVPKPELSLKSVGKELSPLLVS